VDTVFLFAARGNYGDPCPDNVTIITKAALVAFDRENRSLLPKPIAQWLALQGES
jgi:hypothetical protein